MNSLNDNEKFLRIRQELDHQITYGSFESAEKTARYGLIAASRKGCLSEEEYFKGQLEILKGDYNAAIRHFGLAIENNPQDGAAFNDLALCMVELGKIDEALSYFDRGMEAEPDYATIHHNKGWLLNKIGRCTEALKCFQKAIQIDKTRAVTYENMADALASLGDYKKALLYCKKAVDNLPCGCDDIKKQLIDRHDALRKKNSLPKPKS